MRIISRTFDSWIVEFNIEMSELLDQARLVHHLRRVKTVIAQNQRIPEPCLKFDGIVRKQNHQDDVLVTVRITKKIVRHGNPRITFRDSAASDGTTYSHMQAFLDLMYLDAFEQIITLDRVHMAIREARIHADFVDHDMLTATFREVLNTQQPVENVPIAIGSLPESGSDAEVEFFFRAVTDPSDLEVLYSSRRVKKGDLLCRKRLPGKGGRIGHNVLGEILEPRPGLDITLTGGQNASVSLDGTSVIAEEDGVVGVSRKTRIIKVSDKVKQIPEELRIQVNPIRVVESNDALDVTTSSALEIRGNLRVGSRVISQSEVYVSGNVEEGSTITASDDVMVTGNVSVSEISSSGNVLAGGSVSGARISAGGEVYVKGVIEKSEVTADKIVAESASGSKLLARSKIMLDRIDADVNNVISTISIGMTEYFYQRLRENEEFLEKAKTNLERIRVILGTELYEQAATSNVQSVLMRFLTRLRIENSQVARKQIDMYRQIIEAVVPTLALIEQKERECLELTDKLLQGSSHEEESQLVIREKVATKTLVMTNGKRTTIGEKEGATNYEAEYTK